MLSLMPAQKQNEKFSTPTGLLYNFSIQVRIIFCKQFTTSLLLLLSLGKQPQAVIVLPCFMSNSVTLFGAETPGKCQNDWLDCVTHAATKFSIKTGEHLWGKKKKSGQRFRRSLVYACFSHSSVGSFGP